MRRSGYMPFLLFAQILDKFAPYKFVFVTICIYLIRYMLLQQFLPLFTVQHRFEYQTFPRCSTNHYMISYIQITANVSFSVSLTHWGGDEMDAILQTTFKYTLLNENILISIKISMKFIPKGSINNIEALVQIMTWRLPGVKPLSETKMIILLTHICATRPQ